jgi:hypothetical protein
MKELKHETDTNSYMQLCLHQDGGSDLYLMVPTYWDAIHKKWLGFIKTPISKKLIHAEGKDSFELQNNFNLELNKLFTLHEEEAFSMFKPLEYWETRLYKDQK